MKNKRSFVAVFIIMLAVLVKGADFNWIVSEGGTSPIDAFQFSEVSNWHEGRIPSSIGDMIYFTNLTANTTFVKCPDDLAGGIIYGNGNNNLILMGKNLALGQNNNSSGGISCKIYGQGRDTYAHFDKITCDKKEGLSLVIATIAAQLETPMLTIGGGNNYYRFRYYAPHGNELRNDEVNITDKIVQGDGSFYIEVPPSGTSKTGLLKLMQNSPYAQCPDNLPATSLTVGSPLSGEGIPEGAYLRRIFNTKWIELSEPSSISSESATVTFGSFNPVVKMKVSNWHIQGNSSVSVVIGTYSSSPNPSELEILDLNGTKAEGMYVTMGSSSYTSIGKLILHATTNYTALTQLNKCRIQFEEGSGFTACTTTFKAADSKAEIIVTNNITAEVSAITNYIGTIRKTGAGTLRLGIGGIPTGNTGSLVIDEGTVKIIDNTNGVIPRVSSITLSSGSTLVVPESGMTVENIVAEEGAVIMGTGKISILGNFDLNGAVIKENVLISLPSQTPFVHTIPEAAVVGDPAMWFAADNVESLILSEDGTKCLRWNDVRGEGYAFATNVIDAPTMVTNLWKMPVLRFTHAINDIGQSLVWDSPKSGIRAVFTVTQKMDSSGDNDGGPMLATSGQVPNDFHRDSFYYTNPLCSDIAAASVKNGQWYMDGEDWNKQNGWPLTDKLIPRVAEVHLTSPGATADAFGFGLGSSDSRIGEMEVCEVIVYTNELSYSERLQVAQYLMKKWRKADASYQTEGTSNGDKIDFSLSESVGFDVESDRDVRVDVVGSSDLVKCGNGTLHVMDAAQCGNITVKEGKLVLNSVNLDSALDSVIDYKPVLHLDATTIQEEDLTVDQDGNKRLNTWKGLVLNRDATAGVSTNAPKYKIVRGSTLKDSMPVVDFGPIMSTNPPSDATVKYGNFSGTGCYMKYTKIENIHSLFVVVGSAQGGSVMLGASGKYEGYNDIGVMREFDSVKKCLDSDWTRPIVSINYNYARSLHYKKSSRVKVNGIEVEGKDTGLSGSYDIVSMTTHQALKGSGLACIHYGRNVGGQELGEVILFTNELNNVQQAKVDAYLKKKWFGQDTVGYRSATADKVIVEQGATVSITGGGNLTTAVIGGGGVIEGNIEMVEIPEIEVFIKEDGTPSVLTVSGNIDFAGGGIIRVIGNTENIKSGLYDIIRAMTISNSGRWTCETDIDKNVVLKTADGVIRVSITNPETLIIIK